MVETPVLPSPGGPGQTLGSRLSRIRTIARAKPTPDAVAPVLLNIEAHESLPIVALSFELRDTEKLPSVGQPAAAATSSGNSASLIPSGAPRQQFCRVLVHDPTLSTVVPNPIALIRPRKFSAVRAVTGALR